MRQDEIPALLKLARMRYGKPVDDLGRNDEKMVPSYETKEKIMRNMRLHVRFRFHPAPGLHGFVGWEAPI